MQGDNHGDPSVEACDVSLQHSIEASMTFIEVDLDGPHHVNPVACEQRGPRLMSSVKPAATAMAAVAGTTVPQQCSRKSSDSQDFEFNMLGLAAEMVGPACNVSPADELFYKGQLLPLQLDTRLQYMHQRRLEQASVEGETRREDQEKEEGDDHHDRHGLLFSSPSSDIRDLHSSVKFSSCRMDQQAAIDATSLLDFRCASFPSQASFFWDAGPVAGISPFPSVESSYWDSSTAGGDSNCSSSRDSSGSSQDSCYNPPCADKNSACGRMHHHHHHHHHHHCNGGRLPSALSLKFWWKSLFVGLKKSSRVWVDQDLNHSLNHSSNPDFARRPSLLKNAYEPTASAGNQGLRRPLSSTDLGSKENLPTGHEKDNQRRPAWARWQCYARKLKLPLPTKTNNAANPKEEKLLPEGLGRQGDHAKMDSHAKGKLGSHGGLARPPLERHLSQSSLLCNTKVGSCSAMPPPKKSSPMVRFNHYGSNVVASCPASVLSSPNHMLSPSAISINGSNNSMSTMQELHSAVQGAIAHCKQSIAGHSTSC